MMVRLATDGLHSGNLAIVDLDPVTETEMIETEKVREAVEKDQVKVVEVEVKKGPIEDEVEAESGAINEVEVKAENAEEEAKATKEKEAEVASVADSEV